MTIFFSFTEDSKSSKRKVQKGYISSNTAYMLVYKKAGTSESQKTNAVKVENNSTKDALDSARKGKRKGATVTKSAVADPSCSPKKLKTDSSKNSDTPEGRKITKILEFEHFAMLCFHYRGCNRCKYSVCHFEWRCS